MPHVCVIGTRGIPAFVGGVETICEKLYPLIVNENSFKVTLLSRYPYNGDNEYVYKGVKVKVLKSFKISGLETFFHTFIALCYARLFVHPNIVHLHGIGPGFFSPLARIFGFKTVVTHHSPDYKRPKWKWYGKLILKTGELMTVIFANKIICVSDSVKSELDARFSFLLHKREVIRNAGSLPSEDLLDTSLELLEFLNVQNKRYLLAVGRLDATKGFDGLVQAYSALASPEFKLVIVGDNYIEDDYVKKLCEQANENIIFAGAQTGTALASLYKNAALLVNPSYMEGYCLVVAEALSANVPIVASNIPPHREFKLNEVSYVEKGNVDELRGKLAVPDFTIFRSEYAEGLQARNTWNRNASEHVALFSSL